MSKIPFVTRTVCQGWQLNFFIDHYIAQFQKISILPPWKVFFAPPPPRNSSLASYLASKILAFITPLPLG